MINDQEFKAKLKNAVLDFLERKARVPTQKELKALYGITSKMIEYFRKTRGHYQNADDLIRDCLGPGVLEQYQVPFENELRLTLLQHMEKYGCLPLGREYGELYGISYGNLRYKARKKGLSKEGFLWDLVKDDIQGTDLENSFVRPYPSRQKLDPELIKKKLQEGYSLKMLGHELNISDIPLKKFVKENDLKKYLADMQTRHRRAKGLKDLRQYHDYIKKSLEEGLTIWQIARELDVEFKSIRSYVKIWKLWHPHKTIGPPPPKKKFRFE